MICALFNVQTHSHIWHTDQLTSEAQRAELKTMSLAYDKIHQNLMSYKNIRECEL